MRPRAVITGMGLVTPIGNGVKEYWAALTAGRSGIGPITLFDTTGFAVRIGGEVRNLDFSQYMPAALSRKMSRASKLAVAAAKMAQDDSGLEITDANRHEVDIFMGVAAMDFDTLAANMARMRAKGPEHVSPLAPGISVAAAPAGNVSVSLGVCSEMTTVTTGCSSSNNAVGHAVRKIHSGASRVVFAGGTDTSVQPDLIAAYSNARALSRLNETPAEACRPFEARRDGHVVSEAAGILVLEEYRHARDRGARIYAEVAGYGTTSDCHSMFQVSDDVGSASRCIQQALRDAGADPDELGYYCAHGTASRNTDARETNMLKAALGRRAYGLAVSSIKSMTGHPFGAAGVLETAACALAIHRRAVPPTINYHEPDPACDLDYVPNEARQQNVRQAISYCLGMGGNNSALVLKAC
ncbi:MAG TPA: beta-ketoacyl-ACP synthase II [Planctomycetota bacterium]|nr:beta-ketoacyl-ACP synthase II [Planctomycetota bacterium]